MNKKYSTIKRIGHLIKFYDSKLSRIQKNAKKLLKDPILGSLDHIQDQLNELKERHRRYIFAVLSKKYGEFKARDLAQNEEIKNLVDNFDDLDKRILEVIDIQYKKLKKSPPTNKIKFSYYYKNTEPKDIKEGVIEMLKDHMPDLVRPPKKSHRKDVAA